MAKPQRPEGNQVFYDISRDFDPLTGFGRFEILPILVEIGYSASEAKRLRRQGSIQVWDTRIIEDNKFIWFRRPCEAIELLEIGEPIFIGNKIIIVKEWARTEEEKRKRWMEAWDEVWKIEENEELRVMREKEMREREKE